MIRISITLAALEAIAASMPLGSVSDFPEPGVEGERHIWVEPGRRDPEAGERAKRPATAASCVAGWRRDSMGKPSRRGANGDGNAMPIYVTLFRFTEKGIHNVKDTVRMRRRLHAGPQSRFGLRPSEPAIRPEPVPPTARGLSLSTSPPPSACSTRRARARLAGSSRQRRDPEGAKGGFRATPFVTLLSLHCKGRWGMVSSMFARASLIALVLASPAWADSDYPAGLFERSPLNDTPAAASSRGHNSPKQAKSGARERASGGCHHYREWRYPGPQPC